MKIIFYNVAHIGDTIYSQNIVKEFCKQNPDYDISIFIKQNWFFYSDIPNLKIIGNEVNKYKDFDSNNANMNIDNDIYIKEFNYYIHLHPNTGYIFLNNILYINTWIANRYLNNSEVNLFEMSKKFKLMINDINKEFNISLKFENVNTTLLTLPYLDIDFFINYRKNKKIIFYYNNYPQSGQAYPNINHDNLINYLSDLYDDYIIITSLHPNVHKNNVISLDYFNIEYTPCCKNLYYCIYFAMNSDLVFSFDSGSNFLYSNDKFNETFKGKWYHISINTYYYDTLNKYLNNPNVINLRIQNESDFKNIID